MFTRNSYTKRDYNIEQKNQESLRTYQMRNFFESQGVYGGLGNYALYNIPKDNSAKNAVDIESYLHGTRSCDLTNTLAQFSGIPNTRERKEVTFLTDPRVNSLFHKQHIGLFVESPQRPSAD